MKTCGCDDMERRAFIQKALAGVGTVMAGSLSLPHRDLAGLAVTSANKKLLRANDTVTMGKTGIKASRLAIGTGSNAAEQRKRGVPGMVKLFHHAMDRGLYWLETADLYKTHPHVQGFLREIEREKVVVTSKTLSKTAEGVRSDIERFRKELDTDYIDILLFHCMSEPDWPEKMKGPMDALSDAKEKGYVRAIGCSLHVLGALEAACKERWGDVYLVRLNPFAVNMDVDKPKEISKVEKAIQLLHKQGKAVYGMKLLGGTNPHIGKSRLQGDQIDASLRFALSRSYLDGFTIGFSREKDIDDIFQRIERVQQCPNTDQRNTCSSA